MKKKLGLLVTGFVALALIAPSYIVLTHSTGARVVEDQPVDRLVDNEGGDYYETEWVIDNGDTEFLMWSQDKPTDSEIVAEFDGISAESEITSVGINTEDETVYPMPPFLATILQYLIPLALAGTAMISFGKMASATKVKQSIEAWTMNISNGLSMSSRGQLAGDLIGLVISAVIAMFVIGYSAPHLIDIGNNISGIYGTGILFVMLPVILVVVAFYKVVDEAI